MMVMIGAAAVAVVVILFLVVGNGEKAEASGTGTDRVPAAAPAPKPKVDPGTAIAGKTPDRPAPALTAETLGKLDEILAEAKSRYNEGVRKRNAGDNMGARAEQAVAKQLLDDWEGLVRPQLNWQEEAQLEDWAEPAEYGQLSRRYPEFSSLQKMVRMGGGK